MKSKNMTLSIYTLCILSLGFGVLIGCDGDTTIEAPQPVTLTGTIQGNVIDTFTQTPIAGATVSLNVKGVLVTDITGPEGEFGFTEVPVSDETDDDNPFRITVSNAVGFATGIYR